MPIFIVPKDRSKGRSVASQNQIKKAKGKKLDQAQKGKKRKVSRRAKPRG